MEISIIIPNFNRVNDVLGCIQSILEQTVKPLDILIVDDGSTDGSVEKIRQRFPDVNVIVNPRNLGPGFARNNGLLNAKGDYVLFLDSDTAFSDIKTLERFVDFYNSHPEAGCIGGEIRATSQDTSQVYGKIIDWDGSSHDVRVGRSDKDRFIKCDYLATCCCMVSKQLAIEVGGFDPYFSYGGEDKDFGCRVSQKGYVNYLVSSCSINHYHSSSGRNNDETYRFRITSMRFVIKNYPKINFVLSAIKYILLFLKFYLLLPFKALWLITKKELIKKENMQGGYYYLKSLFKCINEYSQIKKSASVNFLLPHEVNKYINYRS